MYERIAAGVRAAVDRNDAGFVNHLVVDDDVARSLEILAALL